MVFRSYHIQIIFRLLLVVLNCFAIFYVWTLHQYWLTLYNLIGVLALQVYLFLRYLTKWQKDIEMFATSVTHGDFNISYNLIDKSDPHYKLYTTLNYLSAYLRQVKSEYVQQSHYLQYVVENTQVGLLAFQEDGKVVLTNAEVLNLLKKAELKTLDDLLPGDIELHSAIKKLQLNSPAIISSAINTQARLSARLSKFVIDGKTISLLSLLNIRSELEVNELQSWQDLISVLTHEIMNSISPIHSLHGSLSKYLDKIEGNEEQVSKARHAVEVMSRRSQALMNFVDRYRKISAVPLPVIQPVNLGKTINEVVTLLSEELTGVTVVINHKDNVVKLDQSMVEQVIINLFRNSIFAMKQSAKKTLNVSVSQTQDAVTVHIRDSGKGIEPDVMKKIFIPFFTTRDGGSGIGLTISRQIMHRHGGSLEVLSVPGVGAEFTLRFPRR
jgi:two-component system, NtrC family, nitrogen regulation sensor histidine kinase NtrY